MPSSADLAAWIADARRTTLSLVADLDDAQLMGPRLATVNPLLWEIGHVAWFQEHWVLQHARGLPTPRRDSLYDSSRVAHDLRWELPLPSRPETLDYLRGVEREVLDGLVGREVSERERYFLLLSLFHEDMHDEAFAMTRQILGHPTPAFEGDRAPQAQDRGDVQVAGGETVLGSLPDEPFVFDNEKWAHAVPVAPFAIAGAATTQGEVAAFVEDGGYRRRELWSEAGWRWREASGAEQPVYWRRDGSRWLRRAFDRWLPLEAERPMVHFNWFEAEAWCRWAHRRLPTEAEWRKAGVGGAAGVWEWTASDFLPFPGFAADPYEDYSRPWFGTHKVLKGGSWATRSRLLRPAYRNFYTPDRRDPFAGFRSCAI
jgi:gamma-glutamyl hercynylcysteine S-oxide synthase